MARKLVSVQLPDASNQQKNKCLEKTDNWSLVTERLRKLILSQKAILANFNVVPRAGAWIETN